MTCIWLDWSISWVIEARRLRHSASVMQAMPWLSDREAHLVCAICLKWWMRHVLPWAEQRGNDWLARLSIFARLCQRPNPRPHRATINPKMTLLPLFSTATSSGCCWRKRRILASRFVYTAQTWLIVSTLCDDATLKNEPSGIVRFTHICLKAWPSEYGFSKANDLGIQVLGGAGLYAWVSCRAVLARQSSNPIHEASKWRTGTDLSFRKLWQNKGFRIQIFETWNHARPKRHHHAWERRACG